MTMNKVSVLFPQKKSKYHELMGNLFQGLGFLNERGLYDDLWEFTTQSHLDKHSVKLDFTVFDNELASPQPVYEFGSGGEVITNKELAKLCFLLSVRNFKSWKAFRVKFRFILHLFLFLKSNGTNVLNRQNLSDFFASLLRFKATEKGFILRLSTCSPASGIRAVDLIDLDSRINATSCLLLLDMPEEKEFREIESRVTEDVLGISFQDYMDGGSFNFLGLEVGRHYIDYCADFFAEGFCYAYATRKAINDKFVDDVYLEFQSQGILSKAEEKRTFLAKRVKSTAHALSSSLCYENGVFNEANMPSNCYSGSEKQTTIKKLLIPRFKNFYIEGYKKFAPLNNVLIREILAFFKLDINGYNIEFFRCLIAENVYFPNKVHNTEVVVANFIESIGGDQGSFSHVDFLNLFNNKIKAIAEKTFFEIVTSFRSGELTSNSGFDRLQFVKRIEYAGLVQLCAISGWRASELMFPIESIKVNINDDPLDSTFLPFRFMVKWKVPKTNGQTQIDREVTPHFYLLSQCLDSLTTDELIKKTEKDKPAIAHTSLHLSTMNYRVLLCWEGFVANYRIFTDLDSIDRLLDSGNTRDEIRSAIKNFDKYYADESTLLAYREVRDKVRRELPYLYAAGVLHVRKRGSIGNLMKYYQEGSLQHSIVEIWESSIPHELMNSIREFNFEDESKSNVEARAELTKVCFRYITDEVAYPTPHAFRHIFAEAVLMRYTSEVGSFIRSAFKHVDERFYMRYLRNKTSKTTKELAKRVVLNQLVRNHLKSLTKDRRIYAGKMDVFMRRIAKQVVKLQLTDIESFSKEYAESELVDLKANPWGFCILKRNLQYLAKCADPISKSPMRHLAKPSLCLDCVNQLVTSDHAEWIMIEAQNAVDIMKQPLVPSVFKKESEQIIKNSIKVLKQLKNNAKSDYYDDFILHLMSAKEGEQR